MYAGLFYVLYSVLHLSVLYMRCIVRHCIVLSSPQTRQKHLLEILTLAQQVVSKIDGNELLVFFGMKSDQRSDAATIKR